ncbi:hypothetical protein JYK22_24935, partial [Nonomuraea sp. RK-328]|nr:hypothetical protein [Nonomuraea sp. RK-328]
LAEAAPGIESHKSIDYRVWDHGPQPAGFTVTDSGADGGLEVSGTCPACHGWTVTPWSYGAVGSKGVLDSLLGRGAPAQNKPTGRRTVYCECGHLHPNRPETAWDYGCGAFWTVELPS